MKKIHAVASFGFRGASYEDDFEFDDDATEKEIEDEIWEWAQQFVDVDFEEIEQEDDEE